MQKDGSEAVAKVNEDAEQYDLIFMDIIMPVFDGVSATACIRLVSPRVPIVAMTSNIRGEDIATYFHWGEYPAQVRSRKENPRQRKLLFWEERVKRRRSRWTQGDNSRRR